MYIYIYCKPKPTSQRHWGWNMMEYETIKDLILSPKVSGTKNGGTEPCEAFFVMEIPLHKPCIHTAYIAEYLYFRYVNFVCEQAFRPSIVRCYVSFRVGKDLVIWVPVREPPYRCTGPTAGAAGLRSVFFFRLEQHESRIFTFAKHWKPKKTSSIRYTHDTQKNNVYMCIIYRQDIDIINAYHMYIYIYVHLVSFVLVLVGHGWLTGFPVSVESTQVPAHHPSRRQKVQDLSKSVIMAGQPTPM